MNASVTNREGLGPTGTPKGCWLLTLYTANGLSIFPVSQVRRIGLTPCEPSILYHQRSAVGSCSQSPCRAGIQHSSCRCLASTDGYSRLRLLVATTTRFSNGEEPSPLKLHHSFGHANASTMTLPLNLTGGGSRVNETGCYPDWQTRLVASSAYPWLTLPCFVPAWGRHTLFIGRLWACLDGPTLRRAGVRWRMLPLDRLPGLS